MRIIVMGASGGTGALLVEQGLARGHELVAVSRRGTAFGGAENITGDAGDASVVRRAVGEGADAVVLAFGGTKGSPTARTDATRGVLAALEPGSVGRIVVHSSIGADGSEVFLPAVSRPVIKLLLGKALADHTGQEKLVQASGFDWTLVRPGGLTDAPATGRALALETPGPLQSRVARADVASFILDCIEDPATAGRSFALGMPA